MYCKNCGKELAAGAKFCMQCGTPIEDVPTAAQTAPAGPTMEKSAPAPVQEAAQPQKTESVSEARPAERSAAAPKERPSFDEFQWNVSEYPDRNVIEKTDEIDFNWNTEPAIAPDPVQPENRTGSRQHRELPEAHSRSEHNTADHVLRGKDLDSAIFGEKEPQKSPESMSAAERIDKFYTFNKKNEEFQQLLNREYDKVKGGNALEQELSQAEERASQRFESRRRPENSTMEEFLESEGVVKPYQPKAFESSVLERIEAQEAEKEAKRLEEEARLAAIEEARHEAEAKRLREEEERLKAEMEARRLEEIARMKAVEEAKLAEEARRRAEEEAQRRAEEEARRKAEEAARVKAEEERRRAEAEARVRAEEEARLRAEADLKAAQEAAKIRAQQEARLAAEAEAQYKAEQEQRRLADAEAQRKLEEERKRLAEQANEAVAKEEVRKALEQTAHMREEEAAKIRAAVAGLRADAAAERQAVKSPIRKDVEDARRATANQIHEMSRSRPVHMAEHPVTGRDTMLSSDISQTRAVDKAAVISGLNSDTVVVNKDDLYAAGVQRESFVQPQESAAPVPQRTVPQEPQYPQYPQYPETAPTYEEAPLQSQDDDFFESLESAEDISHVPEGSAFDAEPEPEAQPIDFREENLEELSLSQEMDFAEEREEVQELTNFGDLADIEEMTQAEEDLGQTQRFEPQTFDQAAGGLQDTMVVQPDTVVMEKAPQADAFAANDFDHYGEAEAQNYINQQHGRQGGYETAQSADGYYGNDGYQDDYYEDDANLSRKELKQRAKERKRMDKQRAKEEKARMKKGGADFAEATMSGSEERKSGGKGRIVLKIILIVLVVILAAEVAGMGIKFLAPQSKAAEFIDSQLNRVIQLITGDDTEYSVIAAQVRTEPMDDKTDLITAQKSRNKGNVIKSITYSSDLSYDQERDGKVSDLVLSQPMTLVEWGRDKENYPVYYDEQVVGEIIEFESRRHNLMNKGDESVLKMIDESSNLYQDTAALKNQTPAGEFTKLEIGEIRQAGSKYYVWVRETVGGTSTERVYAMFPKKKFTMKMTAAYDV